MYRKHFLRQTASILLLLSLFSAGCRKTSDEQTEAVQVLRYDLAIMQVDTSHLKSELQRLSDSFPLYLAGADWENEQNLQRIHNFIEDPIVKSTYAKIKEEYPDSPKLGMDLARIFHRTRKLFPNFKNPTVYTYISYFDFVNRILYLDSALSIALDLYIDNNEARLDEIGIPRYMSRKLNSKHLDADVARVIGSSLMDTPKQTLLDYIVSEGKTLYFMEQVLPDAKAGTLLGYTEEQWLWCRTHERELWRYIVQQNLLFESNPVKFRHFVNEGPFNPLLEGAPARLSQFIGWRIVRAYLKKSGNDFQRLLKASPQEVLQTSGYRP